MSSEEKEKKVCGLKSNALKLSMAELGLLCEFAKESKLPFVIWGEKAVGKTTKVKEFAKEANMRLEVLHLANQDIIDLIGMMTKVAGDEQSIKIAELFEKSKKCGCELTPEDFQFVKNTISSSSLKTEWCRPAWLHNDPEIPTIYFLDEMNRCNKFVSAAMLPFLMEGKIHRHTIGPNDLVIAACNPSNERYAVNDAFEQDEALKDRCGHVILEPTIDEYLEYAEPIIDKVTLSVIRKHSNFIDVKKFDLPFQVEPSRRSIINVMGFISKKDDKWIKRYGSVVIGCYLGTEFQSIWWDVKFQKDQYIDINDLLRFDTNKEKIKNCILAYANGSQTIKHDIFEESIDTIIRWTETNYKDGLTRLDWLSNYLSMDFIPKDSVASLLSKLNLLKMPHMIEHFMNTDLLDKIPEIEQYKAFENSNSKGTK